MSKLKIRKNDEVLIITGKHKGQKGRVLEINKDRVKVDKINIVKKHLKPSQVNPDGGITEFESFIHISNVKLVTKADKKSIFKKSEPKKEESKKSEPKKEESKKPTTEKGDK